MKNLLIAGAAALMATIASSSADDYYMTVSGAGSQTGTDWSNALPKSQMSTTLNTTMVAGDALYLGSGDYGSTTIGISSDGTMAAWKKIIGVDTGSGVPHFSGNGSWSRSNPDRGQWQIISVTGNFWQIDNLELSGVIYAVKNGTTSTASNYQFSNLLIHDVRHGVYLHNTDNTRFDNVVVREYSKHGFRLDRGCDNVVFENCTADLSNGDETWWDYSEPFPFGFLSNNGGAANTNISFIDCVAANNRRNTQGISYWNGDGFVVENNTSGLSFENCVSINNEDGGYDLKVAATLTDCVAIRNYRGFRFWSDSVATNCVAVAPYRRSNGNPTGGNSGVGVWTKDGHPTLSHFTYFADNGTAAYEEGSGNITLTDSILAISSTSGGFTAGSITLGTGTVTYRPGSGTDPVFVNASSTWDGSGDDLNSLTYGDTKGYYYVAPVTTPILEQMVPIADTYVQDGSATTNFGSDVSLKVKSVDNNNYNRIAYLRFPVSAFSGDAESSMLKLKVTSIGGEGSGARPVEIRELNTDSWDESTTTWNTRPSYGALIATIDARTVGETYEIDVTDYIQQEFAGDGIASFALVQPTDTNRMVSFASREDTGNEPILEAQVHVSPTGPHFIDPEADVYVHDGNANTNFGSASLLGVKNVSSGSLNRDSFIRFPLTEMTGPAEEVTLNLVVTTIGGEGSGPRTIEIRELNNDSWDESTMTWNTRASTSGALIATINADTVGLEYSVDVTSYVNQEQGGDGIASFAIVQPNGVGKYVAFGSRENEGNGPRLSVD